MFRKSYIIKEGTLDDTGTKEHSLAGNKPISAIALRFEWTGGAGGALTKRLADQISNIEIIDGGYTIFSMPLDLAIALTYCLWGIVPHIEENSQVSGVERVTCIIPFGRFMGDQEFYFKPFMYDNPQIRITTAATIDGSDGFTTATGKYTILPHYLESAPGVYRGVLRHTVPKSWTTAASGDETVNLDKTWPWYHIMLQARKTSEAPNDIITNLKLSIDNDALIPFSLNTKDIMIENAMRLPLFRLIAKLLKIDDGNHLTALFNMCSAFGTGCTDDFIVTVESVDQEKISVGDYDMTTVGTPSLGTPANNKTLSIQGREPYGCLSIPFDFGGAGQGVNFGSYNEMKLTMTQGVVTGEGNIVHSQIAPK